VKLSAFPPGWCLGYLIHRERDEASPDSDESYEVGFLSIVGMEAHADGIHAVVAYPTGALVRDCDIEHPIVCIIGPGENRDRVARAGVAEYLKAAARTSAVGAAVAG
jgi:hypothetical protein